MGFSLDDFRLDGKVALVTGAGSRGNSIGRSFAMGLAQAGASVVVANRRKPGADSVVAEIQAAGGQALALRADVSDPASVAAMAAAAIDAFGGVDILVNNAAIMVERFDAPTISYPLEEFNRVLAVNLTGALLCAQALVPSMRDRGGGRIVNVVSGGAFPPGTVYGISKLALVGLTTNLAKELGKDNITVNAIAPGFTQSDAGKSMVDEGSPLLDRLRGLVAMRVEGQPEELVGPLLLLCASAGSWITGQTINVDGGWIMRT